MTNWGLASQDVYGALAAVNFADMTLRVAFTADFVAFSAVRSESWLCTPAWIAAPETSNALR